MRIPRPATSLLLTAALGLTSCGEIPEDCSALHCPPSSKYCQGMASEGGSSDLVYECVFYPDACDTDRSCACLEGAGLPDACRGGDVQCGDLGNGVTLLSCSGA